MAKVNKAMAAASAASRVKTRGTVARPPSRAAARVAVMAPRASSRARNKRSRWSRSTQTPAGSATRASTTVTRAPAAAIARAEPVTSNTHHGTAIMLAMLPVTETMRASQRTRKGRLRQMTATARPSGSAPPGPTVPLPAGLPAGEPGVMPWPREPRLDRSSIEIASLLPAIPGTA